MIKLTRLNGAIFWLNPDLVELVDETPNTVVTLVDGKRVIVEEPAETVHERIMIFRAAVLRLVTRVEDSSEAEDKA